MRAKRTIKDSVFRHLFKHPRHLPELYHALTGLPLPDARAFRLNTLTGILVNACRNDLSFTVNGKAILLTEHQSTWNRNIPLRFLIYLATLYQRRLPSDLIYRTTLQKIHAPHFYMLYNGIDPAPLETTLRLSDAFLEPSHQAELVVTVHNINYEAGSPLLERSILLHDYSFFIHKIRDNQHRLHMDFNRAVHTAVEYCIQHNILGKFFHHYQEEVINMIDTKWNLETAIRVAREEASEITEKNTTESVTMTHIKNIMKNLGLTAETAMETLNVPPAERAGYLAMLKN